MSLDEYNKHSTFGPVAGPATNAAASAGQEAYRNRTEPAGSGGHGGGFGYLVVAMARGGWIGRGILLLVGSFIIATVTIGSVPHVWVNVLALVFGLVALAGAAMIAAGIFLMVRRLFRRR